MWENRAQKLMQNNRSVFISYSTAEGDAHKEWVAGLYGDLIAKGFDVVLDQFENPMPVLPENPSWHEQIEYKMGELNAQYLKETQQSVGHLSNGFITRPSTKTLGKLSEKWLKYLDVQWFYHLAPACSSIILVNTPAYLQQTAASMQPSSAGWVLEEFQLILGLVQNNKGRRKKVFSVLRSGTRYHSGVDDWKFPMIDFTDRFPYHKNLEILISYLNESASEPDWSIFKKPGKRKIKCSHCSFEVPFTDPPPRICNNYDCREVRPYTRKLCHACGFNKFTPFALDLSPANSSIKIMAKFHQKDDSIVKFPISKCVRCMKGECFITE